MLETQSGNFNPSFLIAALKKTFWKAVVCIEMKKKLFAIGEGKLNINIDGFLITSCRDSVVDTIIYVLLDPMPL